MKNPAKLPLNAELANRLKAPRGFGVEKKTV